MADKHDVAQIIAAAEKVYNNLVCIYGLEEAQTIVIQVDVRIADERRRRVNLEENRK